MPHITINGVPSELALAQTVADLLRLLGHDPRRVAVEVNREVVPRARHARHARELLSNLGNRGAGWVKLECLADKKTLLPDPVGTLQATETLVKDGFQVLVYTSDDPILAKRLKDLGAASVMPAGSPIGSGQGILNANNLRIILEYLKDGDPDYPVIVDAGVGAASVVAGVLGRGCGGGLLG